MRWHDFAAARKVQRAGRHRARALARVSIALALSLGLGASPGCTEEPEKKQRKRAKTRTSPPRAEPTPPPPPKPEPEAPPPPAPEPEIDRPQNVWWCLCYQRQTDEGPEPVTACRADFEQCQKLERRVAKGSKEIIAESLTHGCRSLSGSHPSDVAGTFEQWQPSKLAGAWVSEGVCQLAAAAAEQPIEPEPAPEPSADPFALMNSELIGDLALSVTSAAIRHQLGQPLTRGAIEEVAATGTFEQVWTYADGLTLLMKSDTRSGPQTLSGVIIEAPSTLQTRRGIGLGASWDEVERAYGDVRAPEEEAGADASVFVAGSIYGGLRFDFDKDAVVKIFLGASAE